LLVPPPPSSCRLYHPPCCQLTLLAAPLLWHLCFLSAGASCWPRGHSPLPLVVPPPLVTPLPCFAPLLFGWLLHFPAQSLPLIVPPPGALASAIHHASTFRCVPLVWLVVALHSVSTPILLQLCLVLRPPPLVTPLLVTVLGVICHRSRRRFRPVQCLLPQSRSRASPNIAISVVIAVQGLLCCYPCRGHPHARPLPVRGFPHHCPYRARPSPGHGPEEGASPSG
jgi:hypothetical protein